jgi:hypothetical protein
MKAEGLQPARRCGSFAEHDLDAKPHRSDEAGDDDGDDGLECIALCLFDAFAPTSQVLKVRPQFGSDFVIWNLRFWLGLSLRAKRSNPALRAHASPSHTAIATRPASASDMR